MVLPPTYREGDTCSHIDRQSWKPERGLVVPVQEVLDGDVPLERAVELVRAAQVHLRVAGVQILVRQQQRVAEVRVRPAKERAVVRLACEVAGDGHRRGTSVYVTITLPMFAGPLNGSC